MVYETLPEGHLIMASRCGVFVLLRLHSSPTEDALFECFDAKACDVGEATRVKVVVI